MDGNVLESMLQVGSSHLLSSLCKRLSKVATRTDHQHESGNDIPKLGPYLQHNEE